MDLEYLRTHPQNIARLIEHQRIRTTPLRAGSICDAERLTLDDGSDIFAKSRPGAPVDFFAVEADGLRWLAAAGAVPVPDVIAATPSMLLLEWIPPGSPSPEAAEQLGRGLARLHASGAPGFGGPRDGYIGYLPLGNTPAGSWAEFHVERRCRPYLKMAVDAGTLGPSEAAVVDRALGRVPDLDEPPSRIHGDLWSGNVHYARDGRAWLVDPAAHGGHREADLAMLALFGAPHLDRVLAAYEEAFPLVTGWLDRVPVHQLHPLLVHVVMFGGGYAGQLLAAARSV